MAHYRERISDTKLFVGDLARDANEKDVERAFSHYGTIRSVWVARNPAGFAFVEFEDARDADDAQRGMDGSSICGSRIRVEYSTGKSSKQSRGPPPRSSASRRAFDPNDRCFECGERGHYAYDCRKRQQGRTGGRRRSRSRSRSPRRSRSRSRGGRRDSRSRSRSRSRDNRRRSRSRSRSNTPRNDSKAKNNRSPHSNGGSPRRDDKR